VPVNAEEEKVRGIALLEKDSSIAPSLQENKKDLAKITKFV